MFSHSIILFFVCVFSVSVSASLLYGQVDFTQPVVAYSTFETTDCSGIDEPILYPLKTCTVLFDTLSKYFDYNAQGDIVEVLCLDGSCGQGTGSGCISYKVQFDKCLNSSSSSTKRELNELNDHINNKKSSLNNNGVRSVAASTKTISYKLYPSFPVDYVNGKAITVMFDSEVACAGNISMILVQQDRCVEFCLASSGMANYCSLNTFKAGINSNNNPSASSSASSSIPIQTSTSTASTFLPLLFLSALSALMFVL